MHSIHRFSGHRGNAFSASILKNSPEVEPNYDECTNCHWPSLRVPENLKTRFTSTMLIFVVVALIKTVRFNRPFLRGRACSSTGSLQSIPASPRRAVCLAWPLPLGSSLLNCHRCSCTLQSFIHAVSVLCTSSSSPFHEILKNLGLKIETVWLSGGNFSFDQMSFTTALDCLS